MLAPYWQVNIVKKDIVKLFDFIEKYGMCSFAFASFKMISVDVHFKCIIPWHGLAIHGSLGLNL